MQIKARRKRPSPWTAHSFLAAKPYLSFRKDLALALEFRQVVMISVYGQLISRLIKEMYGGAGSERLDGSIVCLQEEQLFELEER